jgi:hypothetical protein
MHDIEITP